MIGKLTKVKASRVIGIDASTQSLAFAVFEDEKPVMCDEIFFEGQTVFERLKDAKKKTKALVDSGVLKADYVAIEAAIMVRNIETAIDLAYVYGGIIGELMENNPQVHKVYPITWQAAIGVPNLKKAEKEQIEKDNPGRKPSWYKNEGRKLRKSRILAIAKKQFSIPTDSDNIGDACGLALYASKALTRR